MSQEVLARRIRADVGIGLDPTAITRLESTGPRQRAIRLNEAVAIADVLGLPLRVLLTDEPLTLRDMEKAALKDVLDAAARVRIAQQAEQAARERLAELKRMKQEREAGNGQPG